MEWVMERERDRNREVEGQNEFAIQLHTGLIPNVCICSRFVFKDENEDL